MPTRATKRGIDRTPLDRDCDVLICGASFAGLAVARELAGSGADVMVIDRYEIGERQTSACGIPTTWLTALDLEESLQQTFPELVIHTPHTTVRYDLPWTFSTFDYRTLCGLLWDRLPPRQFTFETAKVERREGQRGGDRSGHDPSRSHRRRAGLAAGARLRGQRAAPRRAAVPRPRGPPLRGRRRPGGVDRPQLRPRRLRLELPRRRGGADRRRLLRPSLPRARAHRAPGRGPPAPTPSATRATGSPTRCARPPTTACSSSATPPGTACR